MPNKPGAGGRNFLPSCQEGLLWNERPLFPSAPTTAPAHKRRQRRECRGFQSCPPGSLRPGLVLVPDAEPAPDSLFPAPEAPAAPVAPAAPAAPAAAEAQQHLHQPQQHQQQHDMDSQRAQRPSAESPLESLPDSLLEEILGSVSRQSGRFKHGLVSHRWERIASSFLLRVNVRSKKEMPEDVLLAQISPCAGITSLELCSRSLESVSDDLLVSAANSWPGLQRLVLRAIPHNLITYWGLRDFLRTCTALKTLVIQGLDDVALPEALPELKALRRAEISAVGGTAEATAKYSGAELSEVEGILSQDAFDRRTGVLDDASRQLFLGTAKALSKPELGLPQDWTPWLSLTKLHLTGNNVQKIPSSLGQLTLLQDLSLKFEALDELPASLGRLSSLTSLSVESLVLGSLPQDMGELRKLRHLKLACPELTSLPESVGSLPKLETLLAPRYLVGLPLSSAASLSGLTSLEAGRCLYSLPHDLPNLRTLQELTLRFPRGGNRSLPAVVSSLSELTSLTLSFGAFTAFLLDQSAASSAASPPSSSLRGSSSDPSASPVFPTLSKLKHLRLNNLSSLSALPAARLHFPALASLDVSYCHALRDLPEDLHLLPSLESLAILMCSSLRKLPGTPSSRSSRSSQQLRESRRTSTGDPQLASTRGEPGTEDHPVGSPSDPTVAGTAATSDKPVAWPSLKRLSVVSCPRLFCHGRPLPAFPALETIHIRDSPLEQICVPPSCKALHVAECPKLRVIRPQSKDSVSGVVETAGPVTAGAVTAGAVAAGAVAAGGVIGGMQLEAVRASELRTLSVHKCPALVHSRPAERASPEEGDEESEDGREGEDEVLLGAGSLKFFGQMRELVIGQFKGARRMTDSLGCLTLMVSLHLEDMAKLEALPESLGSLVELRELHVSACHSLKRLPDGLPRLRKLTSLRLQLLPQLRALPEGMESLTSLTSVGVRLCPQLRVARLLLELPSLSSQSRACLRALPAA